MQAVYQIVLNADQLQQLSVAAGQEALVSALVEAYAEQIGFAFQCYHPREKVRGISVVPGTVVSIHPGELTLTLKYHTEEFNLCSATDVQENAVMKAHLDINETTRTAVLKGEDWPEL